MSLQESPQVFLSYAHRDDEWTREFVRQLNTVGINVWWDEEKIAVGDTFAEKIEEGLRSSDYVIFILDSESSSSSWLSFELGAALGMGKRVIAVVSKDVKAIELPGPIRSKKYLTRGSPEDTAKDVADALALRMN